MAAPIHNWGLGMIAGEGYDLFDSLDLRREADLWIPVADELPSRCIDGRREYDIEDETKPLPVAPRAASASVSLLGAAAMLCNKQMPELLRELVKVKPLGCHRGNASPPASGCAATDAMQTVFRMIASGAVSALAEEIGLPVNLSHDQARWRIRTHRVDGNTLVSYIQARPGRHAIVHGPRREAAAVINFNEGTTLDSDRLREVHQVEVFAVDAWTDVAGAICNISSTTDMRAAWDAWFGFNLGTLISLCSEKAPLVIVGDPKANIERLMSLHGTTYTPSGDTEIEAAKRRIAELTGGEK